MNVLLKHDHDVAGTSLLKIARLMVAVAAADENRWEGHRKMGYKLSAKVAGIKLHLVEKGSILSLRGDGWMVDLLCDLGPGDQFPLPSTSGKKHLGGKADIYFAVVHDVRIKGANAFRHDMTILLMFESQWES